MTLFTKKKLKKGLRNRYGDLCGICYKVMDFTITDCLDPGFVTIEHKTRKADGGTNSFANIILAHRSCNNMKGGLDSGGKV